MCHKYELTGSHEEQSSVLTKVLSYSSQDSYPKTLLLPFYGLHPGWLSLRGHPENELSLMIKLMFQLWSAEVLDFLRFPCKISITETTVSSFLEIEQDFVYSQTQISWY